VLLYVKPEIENILGALSLKKQTAVIQNGQTDRMIRIAWLESG